MEANRRDKYTSVMRRLVQVGRLHRNVFERNISSLGIHHSQHHLLMYLSKVGDVPSQKHISEIFGVSPAAIARSLKGLEAEGYIEKSNIENDGRFNRIEITQKGKEIVEKTQILFRETDNSLFEDFSDDEIDTLNELLNKMQLNLQEKIQNVPCEENNDEKQQNN